LTVQPGRFAQGPEEKLGLKGRWVGFAITKVDQINSEQYRKQATDGLSLL
jgi:hypothetical protein